MTLLQLNLHPSLQFLKWDLTLLFAINCKRINCYVIVRLQEICSVGFYMTLYFLALTRVVGYVILRRCINWTYCLLWTGNVSLITTWMFNATLSESRHWLELSVVSLMPLPIIWLFYDYISTEVIIYCGLDGLFKFCLQTPFHSLSLGLYRSCIVKRL
jgi:hypothetical protein